MGEKRFKLEELANLTGGILTKVLNGGTEAVITKVAPPMLAESSTLALAMNEDEIENLT